MAGTKKSMKGFSEDERAAMKERAKELLNGDMDGEAQVMAKIAEMPDQERIIAEKVHEIVKGSAPSLKSKTWYGMPAYANKEGKAVCFFQPASKFKARYSMLGFNDSAKLDEGEMWPTSFAIIKLTPETEKEIRRLVQKAAA